MAEEDASLLILVVVAIVAVIGLSLSVASFATDESMNRMMGGGGGMMGGGGTTSAAGPGVFEWTVLIVSIACIAIVLGLLLLRGRGVRPAAAGPAAVASAPPIVPETAPASPPNAAVVPVAASTPAPAAVPEPTLVKLLDEDERRMYLEIRSHGGEMFQRDLVALGMFSKAKVTRVLDKLEAKGLVVREAHGMTNRVRLVNGPAR